MGVRASSRAPARPPAGSLSVWVVTDHPSDLPEFYVARRWLLKDGVMGATEECMHTGDLAPLQAMLKHRGLYRMPRLPGDDPVILECWL